jgi:glycosyltransferase involved in cell wall biosynthesis
VGAWFLGAPNVSARQTPLPSIGPVRRFIGGVRYWDSALQNEAIDLFEGFNLPLVQAPNSRRVLTIHDIRRTYPEYGILERTAFKTALRRSFRVADHVITVSQAMKEEILGLYPNAPISVIYNGLDASEFDRVSVSDQNEFRLKYSLPEGFLLAVGHFEKRKNYVRLIDAVARLRDQGRSCCLVIIGNDSGERKAVEQRVASAKLTGQVTLLSGLSDLEVRCAYKLCSLFVFPSTYEGFGIPILEAMAARRPMVLSDMPVFREITQDRGFYFVQHDAEAMAAAIEKVLASESERARLIEYGNVRIQDFSFPSLAAQVERLYQKLLG